MPQKKKSQVDLGDGTTRYRVTWTSEPCLERVSPQSVECLKALLIALGEHRETLVCHQNVFEKAKITHNGNAWVFEMEGIEFV